MKHKNTNIISIRKPKKNDFARVKFRTRLPIYKGLSEVNWSTRPLCDSWVNFNVFVLCDIVAKSVRTMCKTLGGPMWNTQKPEWNNMLFHMRHARVCGTHKNPSGTEKNMWNKHLFHKNKMWNKLVFHKLAHACVEHTKTRVEQRNPKRFAPGFMTRAFPRETENRAHGFHRISV
jgi:hypothetical protein